MRLIALLPGLMLGLCLVGCDRQKADMPQGGEASGQWAGPSPNEAAPTGRLDRSHAGMPAPAATFRDPEGEPVTLAEFKGKPLLVNLWATWCGPCVVEMPTLDALAARDNGVQVLAVSQDLEGREKVDAFFEQGAFKALEPYLDPEMALMMELKVDTLPTTILYDAEGKEVWRMMGRADWAGARAAGLLKEAA